MQEIKDDILERTHQMRSLCLNAKSTAIQTVSTLADQNEQLENVSQRLSTIDASLKETRQNINRLKSVSQRMIDSVRTKFQRRSSLLQPTRKANTILSPSSRRVSSSIGNKHLSFDFHQRETTTPKIIDRQMSSTGSCTDEQIDDTLYDVEHIVLSLKDIAQTMNHQLVGQADTLSHIQEHMIKSTMKIEQQNSDISKIIR